MCNKKIRLTKT